MQRVFKIFAIMVITGILSGCGIAQKKAEAEHIVERYYKLIGEGNINAVLSLYSNRFFENTPEEKWTNMLTNVREKLGALETFHLVSWHVKDAASSEIIGTYVSLLYEVQYSKYKATEEFTMVRPAGKSEFKIIGHTINSEGFLME